MSARDIAAVGDRVAERCGAMRPCVHFRGQDCLEGVSDRSEQRVVAREIGPVHAAQRPVAPERCPTRVYWSLVGPEKVVVTGEQASDRTERASVGCARGTVVV